MSNCYVTCTHCPTDDGTPRRWHWLCAECAREAATQHTHDTGHPTTLTIPDDPTLTELTGSCQTAAMIIAHRRKFW